MDNQRKTEIEMAVERTLERLGLSSGEVSYAQGVRLYGKWFESAVAKKKIQPSRYGENGRNRWFLISEILDYRATELEMISQILDF